MIDGGRPSGGSLEEVVELGLELPVLDIAPVGPVVDRLAEEAHPGVDEPGGPVARAAVLLVIELEAAERERWKTVYDGYFKGEGRLRGDQHYGLRLRRFGSGIFGEFHGCFCERKR